MSVSRRPKGPWRIEWEDASGVFQINYCENLEDCREQIKWYSLDAPFMEGVDRARIFRNAREVEVHTFNA